MTYGCQMNKHDSEVIAGLLRTIGYEYYEDLIDNPDLIIINTCAVRQNAENRILGRLGEIKKYKDKNPNIIIGLCGCVAQEHGSKLLDRAPHLDFVMGPSDIHNIVQIILDISSVSNKRIAAVNSEYRKLDAHTPRSRTSSTQGWISIISGCNNFCSYCIVPNVRGREISRLPKDILTEARNLVDSGYKEITLLGQNVNSYGNDLKEKITFPQLLKQIDDIPKYFWIRFVTSHPKDLSDELIEIMANSEKICKHLHLPVQSGSTRILSLMNRKYTAEQYLKLIEKIKCAMPDISITTDVIVGFPGETEEDFEDTFQLLKTIKFSSAFIFKYSRRSGTAAEKLKDSELPQNIIIARHKKLLDLQTEISDEYNKNYIGKELKVLVENISPKDKKYLTGRSEHNKVVIFKGNSELVGTFTNVKINEARSWTLFGE